MSYVPLAFETYSGGLYVYPSWANAVGWLIAASSMVWIPLFAAYKMLFTPGTLREVSHIKRSTRTSFIIVFWYQQRFAINISPVWEHRAIRQGGKVTRLQVSVMTACVRYDRSIHGWRLQKKHWLSMGREGM